MRLTLVVALLALALALPGILRLETDNSPEVFFDADAPAMATYRELSQEFGSDRRVRLTLVGEGVEPGELSAALDRLASVGRQVPGVRVIDPRRLGWSSELERRAKGTPPVLAVATGLVARNGGGVSLAFELPHHPSTARRQALESLLRGVDRSGSGSGNLVVHWSGLPVLDRALDRSSQEIVRVFFPWLVVSATVLLGLALRRRREVVAALLYVGFCLGVTLGTMGWLGVRLNLVVAVLPPVLFSIALATAVHLLVRFRLRRSEGMAVDEAARRALAEKRWAILWAGLTTLVGFGSLAEAGTGPVRTLGLSSAAGIALLTIAALTLLPALLRFAPGSTQARPAAAFDRRLGWLGARLATFAVARRRLVITLMLLLGLAAAAGWWRLEVESNALTYLPPEHPVRRSMTTVQELGLGGAAVELLVGETPCEARARFDRAVGLARLEAFGREVEGIPGVATLLGPVELARAGSDSLRKLTPGLVSSAAVGLPSLELGLAALERIPAGAELRASHLSADGCRARLTALVDFEGVAGFDRLVAAVGRAADEQLGDSGLAITGEYPLLLATQRRLLAVFGRSAVVSSAAIVLLFLLLTRSPLRTLVALLPNLWPVVVVIGLMGWCGWPLDIATVMVAAVILGLAVDDTVHSLAAIGRARRRGLGQNEAIVTVLRRAAPAYTLTSVLLAAGFGVCLLSDFAPTVRFGGLAALAMGFVWVGALVLLPALLAESRGPGR